MTAVLAGPIPTVGPRDPAPWNVRHARFERVQEHRPDPELRGLWAERLAGDPTTSPAEEPVRQGCSFAEMCEELVAPLRSAGRPDLVVLAHVTPDLDSRDSVAGALAAPGMLVFAVSDQGRLAPFTALRVATAFPDRPHAIVIALDQAVVPYTDPDLSALDDQADHAVALLPAIGFDPVRQWAGVTGDRVAGLLEAALRVEQPDLVILGPALPAPTGFRWRRAPGNQLGTAVFSALSEEMTEGAGRSDPARRITVVEYEPAFRALAIATWSHARGAGRHLTSVPGLRPSRTNRR